jgi:predicted transcriptional regulator
MAVRDVQLQSGTMVGITELGKRKAQQVEAAGKSFTILSYLSEHSPRSIYDIHEYTGIELSELKTRLRVMAQAGVVRIAATE